MRLYWVCPKAPLMAARRSIASSEGGAGHVGEWVAGPICQPACLDVIGVHDDEFFEHHKVSTPTLWASAGQRVTPVHRRDPLLA